MSADALRGAVAQAFPARALDVPVVGAGHVSDEPLQVCVTFPRRTPGAP